MWQKDDRNETVEFDNDTILIATDDDNKSNEILSAKEKELMNLKENSVFDIVPYEDQKNNIIQMGHH